jgi:hypothetical protein
LGGCHAGADNPKYDVVLGMSNDKKPSFCGDSDGQPSLFPLGVIGVGESSGKGIAENGRGLLERNAMLPPVGIRLRVVPFKFHLCISPETGLHPVGINQNFARAAPRLTCICGASGGFPSFEKKKKL